MIKENLPPDGQGPGVMESRKQEKLKKSKEQGKVIRKLIGMVAAFNEVKAFVQDGLSLDRTAV